MKKWLEQHEELAGWQERYVDTMYEAFPLGQRELVEVSGVVPYAEVMQSFRPNTII
jgi:hypothetical protein